MAEVKLVHVIKTFGKVKAIDDSPCTSRTGNS